jgi:hypothetical protein
VVKATIVKFVVLAYPDYDKVFEVCTDALSTQLGSVITQSNRSGIPSYSRCIEGVQRNVAGPATGSILITGIS